jgi:hypothetical protein
VNYAFGLVFSLLVCTTEDSRIDVSYALFYLHHCGVLTYGT